MWLRKSRKEPVLSHISMKNLPESERPYERFQILGAEALSDAELLAIILKTGTKDYTALDLARDLLSECQGNLLNLYEIGYEQLLERRGIGPVKATQLKAIAELSKRIARTGRGYHLSMNCPSSIADYYMEELRHRRGWAPCSGPKSMSISEYPGTGKIMILKCRKLWQRWIWERTQSWICLPMEILQDSGEN